MMNDLIERLGMATGPDRELDRLIEEMLPGVLPHPHKDLLAVGYVISGDGHPTYSRGQGYLAKHYTASIEAALTLLADAIWLIGSGVPRIASADRPAALPWARINDGPDVPGATPAIAICIAALQYLASLDDVGCQC